MKKQLPLILILILAAALRLFALDKFPAGLNADEAAIGYNTYSLLQTGRDEHGASWPLVFRSFDDYKPPVYFYLVLPFVKVLGLSVWAVRLPSALLGIASVYLIYLIVLSSRFLVRSSKDIQEPATNNQQLPLIAALLLAVSPWHLQFSRGGWEVNTALFFTLLGLWAFFKAVEKDLPAGRQAKYLYLLVISLAVSLYTYHSARIVSPLLALSLAIIYWPSLFPSAPRTNNHELITNHLALRTVISATLLGLLLSLPLAGQLLSKEGQSRFAGVSVFADSGPLWQALELRRAHSSETIPVKVLHNQYLSYGLRFVKNYLSHYSPRFLFVTGDEIARSKVPDMGQTYLFLAPFYFLGLLSLLRLDSRGKIFTLFWFLVAPLAAALTFQSPHALRSQNMVIPLTIITAMGLSSAIGFFQNHKSKYLLWVFEFLIFLILGYSIARYLHLYYIHYPRELPYAWQYGFDQIAAYTQANSDRYDKIIISDRYDQPYILMAFFLKYPPESLQKELVMTPRDRFGFSTVKSFGQYEFRTINYEEDQKLKNTLIIAADEPVDGEAVLHTILDPSGQPMYRFISTPK